MKYQTRFIIYSFCHGKCLCIYVFEVYNWYAFEMASFVQVREAIIRTNCIWTSELWNDNQTKTIAHSGMVSDFNVFQIGFLYVFYLLYIVRGSQTMKYLMNTVKPNISSLLFHTCRYISCCYICIKMIFDNSRLPMLNTYIYIIEAYDLQCRCSIKPAVCMYITGELMACDFHIIGFGTINSLR